MKILFDTHTFIWWDSDSTRLSATALAHCTDPANELILSVASLWEIQIKHQLGKLTLRSSLADIITTQQRSNRFIILPIMPAHIFELYNLPTTHKDPFDRLLLAQAIHEKSSILSIDPIFTAYPVNVLW
jgi:PIN domain nuclease of toxin-antitoxin system